MNSYLRNISNRHFKKENLVKPRIKGIYENEWDNANYLKTFKNQLSQNEYSPSDYGVNKTSEPDIHNKNSHSVNLFKNLNKFKNIDMGKSIGKNSERKQTIKTKNNRLLTDNRSVESRIYSPVSNNEIITQPLTDFRESTNSLKPEENSEFKGSITNHTQVNNRQQFDKESIQNKPNTESDKEIVIPGKVLKTKRSLFLKEKELNNSNINMEEETAFFQNQPFRYPEEDKPENTSYKRHVKLNKNQTGEIITNKSFIPIEKKTLADRPQKYEQTPFLNKYYDAFEINQSMRYIDRGIANQKSDQIIHVNIGQIEIKAVKDEKPPIDKPKTKFHPKISLKEYLGKRNKG